MLLKNFSKSYLLRELDVDSLVKLILYFVIIEENYTLNTQQPNKARKDYNKAEEPQNEDSLQSTSFNATLHLLN